MINVSQSFCFIVWTHYEICLETANTFVRSEHISTFNKELRRVHFCTPGEVENVVYDNGMDQEIGDGMDQEIGDGMDQEIGGGSIVVHVK